MVAACDYIAERVHVRAAQFSPSIFKHRTSFVRGNFPQRSTFQDAFECGEGHHPAQSVSTHTVVQTTRGEHLAPRAGEVVIPRGKHCTRHFSERSPPAATVQEWRGTSFCESMCFRCVGSF
jgi:hypothetical protein